MISLLWFFLIKRIPSAIVFILISCLAALAEIFSLGLIIPIVGGFISGASEFGDGWIWSKLVASFDLVDLLLIFVAVFSVGTLIKFGALTFAQWLVRGMTNEFASALVSRYLRADYLIASDLDRESVVSIFYNKIFLVANGFVFASLQLSFAIINVIALLGIIFYFMPEGLSFFLFFGFALVALVIFVIKRIGRKYAHVLANASSTMAGVAASIGRHLKDLKVSMREKEWLASYQNGVFEYTSSIFAIQICSIAPRYFFELAVGFSLLVVALTAPENGGLDGRFLVVVAPLIWGAQRLIPAVNLLTSSAAQIIGHSAIAAEVYEMFVRLDGNEKRQVNVAERSCESKTIHRIKVDRLVIGASLRAASNPISFELKNGDWLLINGPSGVGKTTFVDTLLGLKKPLEGEIEILAGGQRYPDLLMLYGDVAYVSQNVVLFNTSVAENIFSIGADAENERDWERLYWAASLAGLHESEFAEGFSQLVGPEQNFISGGQAQRLSLARALYKGCNVLILDEFSAGLDSSLENSILAGIKSSIAAQTILISISHSSHYARYSSHMITLERRVSSDQ